MCGPCVGKTEYLQNGFPLFRMLKCFFETNTDARGVPIYVPINLMNVQTTDGYVSNMLARYVQGTRHYYGVADVAYTLRMVTWRTSLFASLKEIRDRIYMLCLVLEANLLPATSGWIMMLAVAAFEFLRPEWFESIGPYFSTLWIIAKVMCSMASVPVLIIGAHYDSMHRWIDTNFLMKTGNKSKSSRLMSSIQSLFSRLNKFGSSKVKVEDNDTASNDGDVSQESSSEDSSERDNELGRDHKRRTRKRLHENNATKINSMQSRTEHHSAEADKSSTRTTVTVQSAPRGSANAVRQWYHRFDLLWLPFVAFFFMTLPATVSGISRLSKKDRQYIVAEKVVDE